MYLFYLYLIQNMPFKYNKKHLLLSLILFLQRKTKRSKRTNQRKTKTQRRKEDNFLQDDNDVEENIQADDEEEDDADEDVDVDEDDDEEYSGDISFNMTGKEDPDFSPGIDSLKKAAASLPTRRSSRWLIPILFEQLPWSS